MFEPYFRNHTFYKPLKTSFNNLEINGHVLTDGDYLPFAPVGVQVCDRANHLVYLYRN